MAGADREPARDGAAISTKRGGAPRRRPRHGGGPSRRRSRRSRGSPRDHIARALASLRAHASCRPRPGSTAGSRATSGALDARRARGPRPVRRQGRLRRTATAAGASPTRPSTTSACRRRTAAAARRSSCRPRTTPSRPRACASGSGPRPTCTTARSRASRRWSPTMPTGWSPARPSRPTCRGGLRPRRRRSARQLVAFLADPVERGPAAAGEPAARGRWSPAHRPGRGARRPRSARRTAASPPRAVLLRVGEALRIVNDDTRTHNVRVDGPGLSFSSDAQSPATR